VCAGRAVEELQRVLRAMTDALELGHWRAILHPGSACSEGRVAGPKGLVLWAVVLRIVARSMQLQAQGRVQEAWDRLAEAAALLPMAWRQPTPPGVVARAALRPPRRGAPLDEELAHRITRLVWREQAELSDLRDRFAPRSMKPRGELIEACIEHLCWIEFDPYVFRRPGPGAAPWDDGVSVERERSALCLRGTRLRQFADPANGTHISKSVWSDVGEYRGLCAEALGRLAGRPAPAPWCGTTDASGVKVRLGRLRAWEHARRWRADSECWR
jgi:hypothetical protein